MNYLEAVTTVRGMTNKNTRKVGNNTYAEIEYDNSVSIRLHGTAVVRFYPNGLVKLNSGGYHTHTRIGIVHNKSWIFTHYTCNSGVVTYSCLS